MCLDLERAPRADRFDEKASRAVLVWERVSRNVVALTGRPVALAVLGPTARIGRGLTARPFPSAAYICSGAPPTVYLPYPLVELVYGRKKYPEAFLAFVLGHELGHRVNDYDDRGCPLEAFERPGKGDGEEELADRRAAFYTALAGFSTASVARQDLVARFLQGELFMRPSEVATRRQAVLDALASFDGYEALYQSGLALLFAGDGDAATRLLDWADELIAGRGLPIPEVRVVRALAHVMAAADSAPWVGRLRLPLDVRHLRCQPIAPGRTALAGRPGAPNRGAEAEARAVNLLTTARRLFTSAEELGADRMLTTTGRGCASFYLGEFGEALASFGEADRRMSKRHGTGPRRTLRGNAALAAFGRWVVEHPVPPASSRAEAVSWAQRLELELTPKVIDHTDLPPVLTVLAKYPTPSKGPALEPVRVGCMRTTPVPAGPVFPVLRASPRGTDVAACPPDTELRSALPDASRAAHTQGLLVCAPRAPGGALWMNVRLPSLSSPSTPRIESTLRVLTSPAAPFDRVDGFACGCKRVLEVGATDRGGGAYAVECPGRDLHRAVLLTRADGTVERVVSVATRRMP